MLFRLVRFALLVPLALAFAASAEPVTLLGPISVGEVRGRPGRSWYASKEIPLPETPSRITLRMRLRTDGGEARTRLFLRMGGTTLQNEYVTVSPVEQEFTVSALTPPKPPGRPFFLGRVDAGRDGARIFCEGFTITSEPVTASEGAGEMLANADFAARGWGYARYVVATDGKTPSGVAFADGALRPHGTRLRTFLHAFVPGRDYTIAARVRKLPGTDKGSVRLYLVNGRYQLDGGSFAIRDGGWQEIRRTFTARPSATNRSHVRLDEVEGRFEVSRLSVAEGRLDAFPPLPDGELLPAGRTLFDAGAEDTFRLLRRNVSGRSGRVTAIVRDARGAEIRRQTLAFGTEPLQEFVLPVPADHPRGTFTVEAEGAWPVRYAVAKDLSGLKPTFNPYAGHYRVGTDFDLRWHRRYLTTSGSVNRFGARGEGHGLAYDDPQAFLRRVDEFGLDTLMIMPGFPTFTARGECPWDANTQTAYLAHVESVARATRGHRVVGFELFNEPYLWRIRTGPDAGRRTMKPDKVAAIYRAAEPVIRAANPDVMLAGPCCALIEQDYLEDFLAAGAPVDAVTIHSYTDDPDGDRFVELYRTARERIRRHKGRDLPLYNTEAYFGFRGSPFAYNDNEASRRYFRDSEWSHAAVSAAMVLDHAAAQVGWCDFGPQFSVFGLTETDQPYPDFSMAAINAAIEFACDAGPAEDRVLAPCVTSLLFPGGRGGPFAVLRSRLKAPVEVSGLGGIRAFDLFGNPLADADRRTLEDELIYLRFATADEARRRLAAIRCTGAPEPAEEGAETAFGSALRLRATWSERGVRLLVTVRDAAADYPARIEEAAGHDALRLTFGFGNDVTVNYLVAAVGGKRPTAYVDYSNSPRYLGAANETTGIDDAVEVTHAYADGCHAYGVFVPAAALPGVQWKAGDGLRLAVSATGAAKPDPAGRLRVRFEDRGTGTMGNFSLSVQGGKGLGKLVKVSKEAGRCALDVREAFKAGGDRAVLRFPNLSAAELEAMRGKRVAIEVDAEGASGSEIDIFYTGKTVREGKPRHYFGHKKAVLTGRRRAYRIVWELSPDVTQLGARLDVIRQNGEDIRLYGVRWGTLEDLGIPTRIVPREPKLVLHKAFDGAKGGRRLVLPAPSGLDRACGTLAFWMKTGKGSGRPAVLAELLPDETGDRTGSGCWRLRDTAGEWLELDRFDDDGRTVRTRRPAEGEWTHVAVVWDETSQAVLINGIGGDEYGTSAPIRRALAVPDVLSFSGPAPRRIAVGANDGAKAPEVRVKDLRVYSARLPVARVRELYRAAVPKVPDRRAEYVAQWDSTEPNPYVKESGDLELELVEEVRLDRAGVERLKAANRFRAVGEVSYGEAGGEPYVQTSQTRNSRFVVGFDLDAKNPLHCFEIAYPDDAERTVDVVVHTRDGWSFDATLQVGYATGGENARTGGTVSYRALYWTNPQDGKVGVSFMNRRPGTGAGAAASAIRVFRVRDGRLPALRVRRPEGVPGRWFCVNFEDPAIGIDFSAPDVGRGPGQKEMMDRMVALMRYTGQDRFTYPRVWYSGFNGFCEDGLGYNIRGWHPEGWFDLWYARFDREGLDFVPSMHPRNMPLDVSSLSYAALSDGSLHAQPVAIGDDGLVHPSFAWNPAHPETRAYVDRIIGQVAADAVRHPCIRGVETRVCARTLYCFASAASGYNDYAVEAFAKSRGVAVPASIDRRDPLRGKAYADWLRKDHWEAWLDWRCSVVTENYRHYVRTLRACRPDLVLVLNMLRPADPSHKGFLEPDFMSRYLREQGLDPAGLGRIEGLVLSAGLIPSDVRWFETGAAEREALGKAEYLPGTYALLEGTDAPAVCLHDRYFESAVGRNSKPGTSGSLSCPWYREHPWRTVTINPSGDNQLRHFALPLKFHDLLGLGKGGYLIGTYGMEERLRPFMAAWRALPAVKFEDRPSPDPDVTVRGRTVAGTDYLYAVNCSVKPRTVRLPAARGMRDLATDAISDGTVDLPPWGLRAFARKAGL